jgi:DNA segregation ATPase FtsK/SpoIIIE-like protein
MVDPKVVELSVYNGIPHLIMPVVTDAKMVSNLLKWAVVEMERRYRLFSESNVRNLDGYNEYLSYNGEKRLPLILLIIDELADLMTVAGKDVETQISRLAAKARAAGIHLIIATQRPSVDVITGVIKANLPSRIAFSVASGVDSRTILDQVGAEKLLGKGDMLYYPGSANKPIRGQGAFVSDSEVETIVNYLKNQYGARYDDEIIDIVQKGVASSDSDGGSSDGNGGGGSGEDDLFEQAVDIVIEYGSASSSILQRRLGVGYPRASRLIDLLERKGIIGPFEGSKPRKVLVTQIDWLEMKAKGDNK